MESSKLSDVISKRHTVSKALMTPLTNVFKTIRTNWGLISSRHILNNEPPDYLTNISPILTITGILKLLSIFHILLSFATIASFYNDYLFYETGCSQILL